MLVVRPEIDLTVDHALIIAKIDFIPEIDYVTIPDIERRIIG